MRRPVPCCLCGAEGGSDAFAPAWDCGGFSFVRCRRCGLLQQNPQSEPEAVAARYDEDYLRYEEEHQYAYRDLELLALGDLGLWDAGAPPAAPLRGSGASAAAPLFAAAAAAGRRPRVLDVGCATGAFLAALRDGGWEPQGVEISAAQAAYGQERHGLPIFPGRLEDARFPEGSFELAHASHLIEHLNDPLSFLDEMRRLLAPGGALVLTTPNSDGLQARLLGGRWRSAIYDHLYLFSRRTLRALLEKKGFEIEREITWGGWAAGLEPAFIKRPLDALAKAWGFGDVMAILARRAE